MRAFIIFLLLTLCPTACLIRADETETRQRTANTDSRDRSAAVALNYCRAAFHRIKRNGTKPVLMEEQEKILNNLNLNGIADQEVVTLYTKVLEEIGGETIAEKERRYLKSQFRRNLGRQTMASAFLMSAQVTSLQFGQAVLTGANSWWDYRNLKMTNDTAVWNIDKTRMNKVICSSSQFLDTFWKMIQKNNIPDRWLIRSADLDSLEQALAEQKPETRLRLLQRLEKFMECYPPYWYHVARTHQALGQWDAASETYEKLANYGAGHFRRDEMLATGLANLAAIQDFQGHKDAAITAREALGYADTAWQANLVCARILARHREYDVAEEAVLRNIDAKLERTQSLVALMTVYAESGNREQLSKWLRDPDVVAQVPVPAVLRACAFLGSEEVPTNVNRHLLRTLCGYADLNFGMDDVVFLADPLWQIETAEVRLKVNGRPVRPPVTNRDDELTQIRFPNVSQLGGLFASTPRSVNISLSLKYPHMQPVELKLRRVANGDAAKIWKLDGARRPAQLSRRGGGFLVSNIEFEGRQLSLLRYGRPMRSQTRFADSNEPAEADSVSADRQPGTPADVRPVSRSRESNTQEKDKAPSIEIESVTPVSKQQERAASP